MRTLLCAVDVGTRSARAGIVARDGRLLGRGECPIQLFEPEAGHAEQDSENIWASVCAAVRQALASAGVSGDDVAGIGFDATCSVVVRDLQGRPLSISTSDEPGRDTMVWMDHRALAEAADCTATGHRVVALAGGAMSPEMAIPKAMWLRRHMPERWAQVGHLFDLADFLTWKASGSLARSQCTLACKWAYLPEAEERWPRDFLEAVGLPDLLERGALPVQASAPGSDLGPLRPEAAAELGLSPACRVATGVVDAYAGALGIFAPEVLSGRARNALALIAGTSSCVMTMSPAPEPRRGFWGPYPGVTLPGYAMSEGGQSATGALLDHIIRIHGAGGEPTRERHRAVMERIGALRAAQGDAFAARLHLLPDFHGNRSPMARPDALGVISGLPLDASFDGLCAVYWRCCVAIALGVRQIVEALAAEGKSVDTLHVTGGHTRNRMLMDLYADATGCRVMEAENDEAVLAGTAMLAAAGAGLYGSLTEACLGMRQALRSSLPDPARRAALDRDYRIFLEMQRHRSVIEAMH